MSEGSVKETSGDKYLIFGEWENDVEDIYDNIPKETTFPWFRQNKYSNRIFVAYILVQLHSLEIAKILLIILS